MTRRQSAPRGVLCRTCSQDRWLSFGRRWGCTYCRTAANARWRQKRGAAQVMLYSARVRARRAGVPFSIRYEDIQVPATCPVLGIPLFQGHSHRTAPNSPSLDRFRPEEGYVLGNVQVISHRANMLKNSASCEELEAVLTYMRSHTL